MCCSFFYLWLPLLIPVFRMYFFFSSSWAHWCVAMLNAHLAILLSDISFILFLNNCMLSCTSQPCDTDVAIEAAPLIHTNKLATNFQVYIRCELYMEANKLIYDRNLAHTHTMCCAYIRQFNEVYFRLCIGIAFDMVSVCCNRSSTEQRWQSQQTKVGYFFIEVPPRASRFLPACNWRSIQTKTEWK